MLLVLLQAGCVTTPPAGRSPEYVQNCKNKNGWLVQYTELTTGCEWPTKDAGIACTDKTQCDGYCTPENDAMGITGASLSGTCSKTRTDWDFPNCGKHIVNGSIVDPGCLD